MRPAAICVEHGLLALDADHLEAAVGERQRQRQAHPAETDDRDAFDMRLQSRRGRCGARARYWRANASTKRGLK